MRIICNDNIIILFVVHTTAVVDLISLKLTSNGQKGHNWVKVRPSMADTVCHVTEQTDVNKVDLEVRYIVSLQDNFTSYKL